MHDDLDMTRVQPNSSLDEPIMETMNFLNEAAGRFPKAISFAAGRPPDEFVDTQSASRWIEQFVAFRAKTLDCPKERIYRTLGQYGETNGMIRDLVARWLATDDDTRIDPRAIMVTNGFQEALVTVLLGIFNRSNDVILAEDPSYVGLSGAAAIAGVSVAPVRVDRPVAEIVGQVIAEERRNSRNPRAFYVVPDYSNPSGRLLALSDRKELLALARRENLLILEDVAYRSFTYDGDILPSLKSLDAYGQVLQLGSFAKIFMPGVRLGYLVADQLVPGKSECLAEVLSKVKSFVSVLSAPVAQAVVGGCLVEQGFSLRTYNRGKIAACNLRRARLLECLEAIFGNDETLKHVVTWSRPSGGFFLCMTMPFEFGQDELLACAERYGVIVSPMSFFSLSGAFRNQIRLAFSHISMEAIEPGVEKLHAFTKEMFQRRAGKAISCASQ